MAGPNRKWIDLCQNSLCQIDLRSKWLKTLVNDFKRYKTLENYWKHVEMLRIVWKRLETPVNAKMACAKTAVLKRPISFWLYISDKYIEPISI